MDQAIRCPYCDELSRVPPAAVGQYVKCPNCRRPFNAQPEELPPERPRSRKNVPVVHPVRKTSPAPGWDEFDLPAEAEPAGGPRSVLFGLALLPFVVPLLWILGPTLTGKEAIFTFALPMAIAVSATGLCVGIVLAADWSYGTRIKAILAIVFVMYFAAAFLHFLKAEWVEAIRKQFGKGHDETWLAFSPPDKRYAVRVPRPMQEDDAELVKGWSLKGFRTTDPHAEPATFFVAHGPAPKELQLDEEEKFFSEVKAKALEAVQATAVSESRSIRLGGHPGREFVITLPDRNTKRILRVFRVGREAFVAAVEDAFLTDDASDVRYFFDHYELKGKPPR